MEKFKNVVIGFGKAGKTLAKFLAQHDEEVLLIERSDQMYGGTCINVGCLPSKNMIINGQRHLEFADAVAKRGTMTKQLRNKNYHMVADEPLATVWNGQASFIGNHELKVAMADGTTRQVAAERIFINTGATPVWLKVPGLTPSERIVSSKEAMELAKKPARLAIIGGGYIGLEFAEMFNSFGSEVTILDHHTQLLGREDADIAAEVTTDLASLGIKIELNAELTSVADDGQQVLLTYHRNGQKRQTEFDAVLVAAGRRPNIDGLGLENTDIALTERNVVPTASFLTPPLANVGINERQAQAAGKDYLVFKLPVKAIPKARVLEDQRGVYKAIVERDTHRILGATLYAAEAHETINLIALAMKADLPYETLRDMIFTHPTMSEALNDLFKAPIKQA